MAANGGQRVGLFTPTMFDAGSSVSHLDDQNPALAGLIMLSATDQGPSARTLSAIECGIFADLGYTCASANQAAIPEPSSWLLLGAGVVGLAWRRRRTAVR